MCKTPLLDFLPFSSHKSKTDCFTYDGASRPLTDTTKNTASVDAYKSVFTYDLDSNVLTKAITPNTVAGQGTHTYTYDWANRLNTELFAGTTTTYVYDAAGNRASANATGTVPVTKGWTYDQRNRLLTETGAAGALVNSYTWTPRGVMWQKKNSGGTVLNTLTFDGFARLTNETLNTIAYTYDGLDRIATRNTVAFTYSGQGADPIADGTTKITRTPDGTAISTLVAGAARTAITNTHGDHVAAIDGTGNVSNTRNYEPFGTVTASTGSGAPTIGYQSDWTDPSTANVWMGARFYSPGLASFMSRDTYSGQLSSPVSLNRYTYANNNPLTYSDPTGHAPYANVDACLADLIQWVSEDVVQITCWGISYDNPGTDTVFVDPFVAMAAAEAAADAALGARLKAEFQACMDSLTVEQVMTPGHLHVARLSQLAIPDVWQ
jgi:RHS repeat-associated protein